RFVLGRVPLADDAETYEVMGGSSTQARARAQGKLSSLDPARADAGPAGAVDGVSSSSSSSMSGSIGSDGADVGFGGGKAGSLPSLGGDAPQGSLVAGAPQIPSVPQVDLPGISGLGSGSASQSVISAAGEAAPGRPMAGALNSALQFSNDIGNRALPSGGLPGSSSPAMFSGALGGGSGGAGSLATGGGSGLGGLGGGFGGSPGSLVTGGGQTLASGGGDAFSASSSGSSFGSLGSSAPQGSYVATQSPAAQAAADVRRQVAESSARLDSGGIPSSALTGARRDAPGYQDWSYGSTSSRDPVSASSRVDISSGLGKPQYPSLPSTLRFRYIGAPLWWSGRAGASMTGSSGDGSDPESQSSSASRALRAGLKAASSAASIWRSILVSPSRGGGDSAGSAGGGIDRGWDNSAEQMSSTSSRMDGY
ncbi:MAG: hypothetical protein JST92_26515, partial [Deltaproteobacteria bacterium]|nr:hypothetical protein [Deltaproteobacteria bacterium]